MTDKETGYRVYDQGAIVRVVVPRGKVQDFARAWPGSELPDHAIAILVQRSNGDLIEIYGAGDYDGGDLLALSHGASCAAARVLALPQLRR